MKCTSIVIIQGTVFVVLLHKKANYPGVHVDVDVQDKSRAGLVGEKAQ